MQEGRRSLLDISQAAQKVTRKFDPLAGHIAAMPPRRENRTKSGSERGSILAISRRELVRATEQRYVERVEPSPFRVEPPLFPPGRERIPCRSFEHVFGP